MIRKSTFALLATLVLSVGCGDINVDDTSSGRGNGNGSSAATPKRALNNSRKALGEAVLKAKEAKTATTTARQEADSGDTEAASVSINDSRVSVTSAQGSVEVALDELEVAASGGACDCSDDSLNVLAQDGSSSAQVVIDGCNVHVSATDGTDSATVDLTGANCGELAAAIESVSAFTVDLSDAVATLDDAIGQCSELDAIAEEWGMTEGDCNIVGDQLDGVPVDPATQDEIDAAQQEGCDQLAAGQAECDAGLEEAQQAIDDAASYEAELDAFLDGMSDDVDLDLDGDGDIDEDDLNVTFEDEDFFDEDSQDDADAQANATADACLDDPTSDACDSAE